MVVQQRDATATGKIDGYQRVSVRGQTKASLGVTKTVVFRHHNTAQRTVLIHCLRVLATPLKDLLAPASSDI